MHHTAAVWTELFGAVALAAGRDPPRGVANRGVLALGPAEGTRVLTPTCCALVASCQHPTMATTA